ncbi:MAG TPA: FAD-linked oxidase C-terminal domain-containing protein [Saprospiraceae bacterium]|nr:FAD-linked oxidase C-terminal domain-containing protein [Saprospiraceae bacterium]HMT69437.1 FAD-linked oxidase C-terminal domain-containing protein [Saprospiraceae bacterium]
MATIITAKNVQECIRELNTISTSEIKSDDLSLGLYATDASLYQIHPLAVAIPSSEADLINIIQIANKYNVPVLPRGSATSLAGQTTNQALIIDFTKYFDKILDINAKEQFAIVHPGVVRDQLNTAVKDLGLHFAPDPATTSRATIGGMIANNSSGTKSIKYGKTIDHVLGLKVLLMDGTILHLGELSPDQYEAKCKQTDREGEIYRSFRKIIFEHSIAIETAYPKVMRRVNGYPLDEFIHTNRWNLAKIFAGSEGSLGIILQAKVNLEPIPKYKAAFTVHYDDRMAAIREVNKMIAFDPAAIEMLDFNVFEQSVKNNMTKSLHQRLITGVPQATLSVEFFCLSQDELDQRIAEFTDWLKNNSAAYAYPILRTAAELDDSWALRKNGLGLLMGDPAGRKPIPFIEDQAIPLEHLADYIQEVLDLCKKYGVETILYAHASVGVLHVRPSLDMTSQSDIDLMKIISDDVFHLVKKYKGAWSGEHGDGRNRGPRLKDFFGDEVYQCLKDVKAIFDPKYLLNPGVIIDVPPMDQHLRYGADYSDNTYDFVYKYRKDHSFGALVHNCSGVGACRNHVGGTMCPSFKATSNEADSTRGRANALRLAISGQLGFDGLTDPKVLDTLDLCLSCKACKSECPSNVDMAKLKSEVLQKKYDEGKITLREKAINANVDMVSKIAGWKAPFVNFVQGTSIFKYVAEKVLKVDRRRTLPSYTTETLESWYKKHYKSQGNTQKVALFADTYINYHEPQVGKAAIKLLTDCGYEVILASVGCCQRPRISNGFLKEAKTEGTAVAEKLLPYIKQGMKIVVCEPSCTSALIDDLPDLIEDINLSNALKSNVMAMDVFLADALASGQLKGKFVAKADHILLHGHCHQKASFGTSGMKDIYQTGTAKCNEPDSGCCGMAGSFGYEVEHYDVSKKISELVLIPAIKAAGNETLVVANGFSCRHQIHDFAGKKAVHWVESVEFVGE